MTTTLVEQSITGPPLNADYVSAGVWRKTPAELKYEFVTDVATGPDDRLYILTRQPGFILIYEADGAFVGTIGRDHLGEDPHGLVVAGDRVLVADQFNHVVRIFTTGGKLVRTIGTFGVPSDTGVDDKPTDVFVRAASIVRSAAPFNRPTAVAVAPNGDLYVADGYNNSRVHQFSSEGRLIRSWGDPGPLPGQFWIVHHIALTVDNRVLVVDRGNERVQVFSADGHFLAQWTGLQHPSTAIPLADGTIMVAELSWKVGAGSFSRGRINAPLDARISILSREGKLLRRSVNDYHGASMRIRSPHGIAVDSRGVFYVADLRVARDEEPQHQMVRKFMPRA